jgi:hypothetical protein
MFDILSIDVSSFLLIIFVSLEVNTLWSGLHREIKLVSVLGAVIPAVVVGGWVCYQMIGHFQSLLELNMDADIGGTPSIAGSPGSPWSLGSVSLMLAQLAAVLPFSVLIATATYRHRSSTWSTNDDQAGWFLVYNVVCMALPVLTWPVIHYVVEAVRGMQQVRMSSFYVSLIVWVIIGLASGVYYVKNRFVSAGGQAG